MRARTETRIAWQDLPAAVRGEITGRLCAPVVRAETQGGGFTAGLAARLLLGDGRRVFVKGIPTGHPLAGMYEQEAAVAAAVPSGFSSPALLWSGRFEDWVLLLFDDVDGRHPSLAPGSADLPGVLATVASMGEVLSPCPYGAARPVAEAMARVSNCWRTLAADPPSDLSAWCVRHLPGLVEMETRWMSVAEGDTLLHADLRPDNMVREHASGVIHVVDWAFGYRGAAWFDIAWLVPYLIMEGHSPVSAEQTLAGIPAWRSADPDAVTALAISVAGHWELARRRPSRPRLRAYQKREALAALAWTAFRTGWR
ncbi:phosphotransferase [Streptomyces sp. 8L]|uniref:phosphotransferase n=1 Tax=Streptomyces sp. 8L TaxID=2877242 RepID=UPI001CD6AFE0|nr:phosphotransferase [Streptomyces sp. 8L]MCA1219172.1 aminoglycoside phosphotransferase family protein [Streptomyces sp. 8L]